MQDSSNAPPTAILMARPRRVSWAWILPLAALLVSLWLGLEARATAGLSITVRASDGHGIDAGDAVRFRGIEVGRVHGVRLSTGLDEVVMDVVLEPFAAGLAREGTGFWIARPHVALENVAGLETLFGARYLAVLSGPVGAAPQRNFVALEDVPVGESFDGSGLRLVLEAPARFGLAPGAPLSHRGVEVGHVASVELADDGARVEVELSVGAEFASLVRANTRFWEVGGAELSVGISRGLHLDIESLRSLLVGGIAFGTPDDAGLVVEDGHRFTLESEPPEEADEWRPALAVGRELGPLAQSERPDLRALKMTWREGLVFKSDEREKGWGIVLGGELIAPKGLVLEHKSAKEDSTQWSVDGKPHALLGEALRRRGALVALGLPTDLIGTPVDFPLRDMDQPEACLVAADPDEPPIALDASRLEVVEGGWRVDAQLAFSAEWNGAPVMARSDGALLGLLVVGESVFVAPLP